MALIVSFEDTYGELWHLEINGVWGGVIFLMYNIVFHMYLKKRRFYLISNYPLKRLITIKLTMRR